MQTFGTNYRNCATCGRWAGQRSTDTFGSMVQTMPNAQPIINHCVQNAETWCHEHILNASNHATGMSDVMQGTAEVHGEILSAATGGIHEAAWIDPSGSVTSHPIDVMATHFEHVDTVGQAGDVLGHAVNASEAAGHVADHAAAGFHVPWFTVLRSGHREFQLLQDGKTDGLTASKNFAIDAGSMAAGTHLGAAIGTFIVPGLGTVIGAAIGGFFGKKLGAEVKQGNLNAAVTEYEQHATEVNQQQKTLESTVTSEFNNQKLEEQRKLDADAQRLIGEVIHSAESYSQWGNSKRVLRASDANKIFNVALDDISGCIENLNRQLSGVSFLERILWPSVQVESVRQAIFLAEKSRKIVDVLAARTNSQDEINATELLEPMSRFGLAEKAVRQMMQSNEVERKRREEAFHNMLLINQKIILEKRFESVGHLDRLLKKLAKKVEGTIEPMVSHLNKLSDRVITEKQKLGLA